MERWTGIQVDVIRDRMTERIDEANRERLARSIRSNGHASDRAESPSLKQRLGRRLIAVGTAIAHEPGHRRPAERSAGLNGRA